MPPQHGLCIFKTELGGRLPVELFVFLIFKPCDYYLLKRNVRLFKKCNMNIFSDTNYTCVLKSQNHFLREGVYCQSKVVKNLVPSPISYRPINKDLQVVYVVLKVKMFTSN